MHGEPSIRDDSTLLARWALENSEQAFAEIVRNYERLVLGAALRRTGNVELARDVAQQVFTTLASKARLLMGRPSIAGWLYRAASHIAARTAQSERRWQARQQSLGEPETQEPSQGHWPLVEEALAAIGATDRESLVLHYFQDLAYAEIAAVLGIQETAARKRVSRALRNLERQIRRRGVHGPTAGLLIAAAAQQGSMTTQAGLASAALAANGANAAPWLTFTTIMSHTPIKIAACASALALAPVFAQRHANASLRAQIATEHAARPQIVLSTSNVPLRQRRAALESELAAKHAARIAAENRFAQLATFKDALDQEVVISLGTIESMARKLAQILSIMHQLDAKPGEKLEAKAVKDREMQARQAAEALPEVMGILREIPKLERDPDKAAHFYALTVGETLGLDEQARATMEADIAEWVRGLQQEGLALVQRPQGKAKEWDDRRDAATVRLLASLKNKLPSSQQKNPAIEEFLQLSRNGSDGLYDILTAGSQP